jgi:pimeloyl-ACP methyl ester carboxylesterase
MQSSYFFLNGLRVHYLHWNLGDVGPPVVLLHGLASNARIWELAAPYLVERGLVPLAPDARGHGLTDKPEAGYNFETITRDLAAFLEAANLERPVLVGHSWGAQVALDYASRMLAGPRAPAGLVLVDGGMTQLDDSPGATWERTSRRLAPPRLAGMPLAAFLERLGQSRNGWQPDDRSIPIILANFEIVEDEDGGEKIYPRLTFDRHMQIVQAMWDFKTYERFERVRCPVLMIPARPAGPLSESERAFLAFKERGIDRAREKIAQLQVQWMEDSVHDIPLQHPAELAALIAGFISSL